MSGVEKLRRKQKAFEPAAPKAEPAAPEPCTTCGPGKVRASYFPSDLRMFERREGGSTDFEADALEALEGASKSELWLMLEDLVERRRDEFISASLGAVTTEAAAAYMFRAQGVETVLRSLRTIRAVKEAKNAPADV